MALAVGGAGLLGGILWGRAATRTAARLAFKIVGATSGSGTDPQLEARVAALEAWKSGMEAAARSEDPGPAAQG